MKISEAMQIKRKIGTNCSLDIKMLDTSDGIVLSIEENSVNDNSLMFITDFVSQHKLNLLLDNERYLISTNTLHASSLYAWDN